MSHRANRYYNMLHEAYLGIERKTKSGDQNGPGER